MNLPKNLKEWLCIINMGFSETEKHTIFYQLSYRADRYVKEEFGEDASTEFFDMYVANFTKDEWNNLKSVNNIIDAVYRRRRYEIDRYYYSKEAVDNIWEDGIPPAVDFSDITPTTLQLGLLVAWREEGVTYYRKKEDEPPEEFERRKDRHDFEFGHVNHEALANPLIDHDAVRKESEKQKEKLQNYIYIISNKWTPKNDSTPGTG